MNSAPAGFKTAVQAALQFFDTTFSNNISLTIDFGWGEVGGSALDAGTIGESSSNYYQTYFTYQQIKTALATADAASSAVIQAVQNLPIFDPTGGASFVIPLAEEKALGLYTGSSTAPDGYVGLDSSVTFAFDPNNRAVSGAYDAIGVLEHEISEVLGRLVFTSDQTDVPGRTLEDPLDLFRYTAPGVHTFQPGSAYFSLNNGATNLKSFNGVSGGDYGDWASSGQADAFGAYAQRGVLQPVSLTDIEVMELLGYTLTPPASTGGSTTAGSVINGTSGNDTLAGGSGADTLHGGPGSDYIDGGGGLNTALYDGVWRQYTVTIGSPTTVAGGPEGGTDSLANIQRIQFVDGYLATSPTDTAGQVYRLYEAALDRAPDPEGLAGWVNALNSGGTTLQTVAAGFVGSTEFHSTYGSLTNTAFITLLYNNVLHRAPDPAGLSGWLGYMAQGHTQADVLLGFSESQEDINDLAPTVQQGLWVGDVNAAEVVRLYDTTLERRPDLTGLAGWTQALDSGTMTLQQVVQGFVTSAEFQQHYGSLDNTAFVTLLYENALHRAPDPAGLAGWVGAMAAGESRAQVVLGFSDSAEHVADTAPYIDSGIWLA